MDFVHFVFTYFGLTAFLVFVLLFGESPAFAGTPVSFCRWLLTEAWMVALEYVPAKHCSTHSSPQMLHVAKWPAACW